MLCFDVDVNDSRYCRAGLDPTGVITVTLNWIELTPETLVSPRGRPNPAATLSVIGYRVTGPLNEEMDGSNLQHVHWGEIARTLVPGDEVRIRIVSAEEADDPIDTPRLPDIEEESADEEAA